MPSFHCFSKTRGAVNSNSHLILAAEHVFVYGQPSDYLHSTKSTQLPHSIDTILAGNSLVFTLSGILDRKNVLSGDVLRSAAAKHLVLYLRTVRLFFPACKVVKCVLQNASQLGISHVSNIHLDDSEDDLPKITLQFAKQDFTDLDRLPVHVILATINLKFIWKTKPSDKEALKQPFSSTLSLPYRNLLDDILGRFTTWQLVRYVDEQQSSLVFGLAWNIRRYPLIFGTWHIQRDVESTFFPKVFRSISDIILRSQNPSFRAASKGLLRDIRRHCQSYVREASCSFSDHVKSTPEVDTDTDILHRRKLTEEQAFCLSLQTLYNHKVRKPLFKGSTHVPLSDRVDDDDLAIDCGQPGEELPHSFDPIWNDTLRPSSPLLFGGIPLLNFGEQVAETALIFQPASQESADDVSIWSDCGQESLRMETSTDDDSFSDMSLDGRLEHMSPTLLDHTYSQAIEIDTLSFGSGDDRMSPAPSLTCDASQSTLSSSTPYSSQDPCLSRPNFDLSPDLASIHPDDLVSKTTSLIPFEESEIPFQPNTFSDSDSELSCSHLWSQDIRTSSPSRGRRSPSIVSAQDTHERDNDMLQIVDEDDTAGTRSSEISPGTPQWDGDQEILSNMGDCGHAEFEDLDEEEDFGDLFLHSEGLVRLQAFEQYSGA